MDDRDSQHYDPKIHRKMHQNANPFVLRRYDGRMKKCRRCRTAFKDVRPQFVIVHPELYIYKRVKGTKRILVTQATSSIIAIRTVYSPDIRTSTCATS